MATRIFGRSVRRKIVACFQFSTVSFNQYLVTSDLRQSALHDMALLEEGAELSPDQIDALLERAERRLKEAQQLVSTVSDSKLPTLPKLQHNNVSTSYIKSEHGVVRTEQRSAVSETQRRLSEQPRKFADPLIVKLQRKQKGKQLFHIPPSYCDETKLQA